MPLAEEITLECLDYAKNDLDLKGIIHYFLKHWLRMIPKYYPLKLCGYQRSIGQYNIDLQSIPNDDLMNEMQRRFEK